MSRPVLLVIFVAAVAVALTFDASPARAGGFEYPDLGASVLGRGATFAARADDPQALYYNPAGGARLYGTQLLLTANLMVTDLRFQRLNYNNPGLAPDRYPNDPTQRMPELQSTEGAFVVPALMMSTDLAGILRPYNLVLLAGLYGPNAHRSVEFPRYCKKGVSPCQAASAEEGVPNPARYDTISRSVFVLFPSLGLAWRPLPWLSVGGVFQVGFASFDYHTVAGAFVGENPNYDVDVLLSITTKPHPAGIFGVHITPFRWLEAGVSVRTGIVLGGDGEVETIVSPKVPIPVITKPNPAPATLRIPFPWVVRAGLRYVNRDAQDRERFDIEADVVWEQTSSLQIFDVLTNVDVINADTGQPFIPPIKGIPVTHNWNDTLSLRFGGAYNFYDLLPNHAELTLRGGFYWESAAMPRDLTRLDFLALERYAFTFGAGVKWGRYRLDVAYALLLHEERTVTPDDGQAPCGDLKAEPGCGSRVKAIVPIKPSRFGDPIGNGHYRQTIHLVSLALAVSL